MHHCVIREISWERVLLKISVNFEDIYWDEQNPKLVFDEEYFSEFKYKNNNVPVNDLNFFLITTDANNKFSKKAPIIPIKSSKTKDGSIKLEMNIVNIFRRKPLCDGQYAIAWYHDKKLIPATIDLDLNLVEKSHVFLFRNDCASYTVSFELSEDDRYPILILKAITMTKNASLKVRFKQFITNLEIKLITHCITLLSKTIGNRKNRILFASNRSLRLNGNQLFIYEKIVQRGLEKNFECNFFLTNKKLSTLSFYKLAKLVLKIILSEYIIIDDYFPAIICISDKANKKIIQVWHAGSGFKSVGYSRFGLKNSQDIINSAHRKYTYTIVGSQHLVSEYAEAFGVDEDSVIPTGLPRIDHFLNEDTIKNIKTSFYNEHPGFNDKKIILFAPTFRGTGKKDAYFNYDKINFDELFDFCGDEYLIIFKMHPFIKERVPIPAEYNERFIDLTEYPSINDLLHITDILITDYSSVIYEFSLLNRPMFFFAYDKKKYSVNRGFHRDYETYAPGKICNTFDELIGALKNREYEMDKVINYVKENFDYKDNKSSDRFIDWLLLGNMPENIKNTSNDK